MKARTVFLILRIIAAVILAQTLFFKFTGAEGPVALFSEISRYVTGNTDMEAAMRIGTGVIELITAILLVWKKPTLIAVGALLAVGTMLGAIVSHFVIIGVAIKTPDGGEDPSLFIMALVVLGCASAVLWRHRGSLPLIGAKLV